MCVCVCVCMYVGWVEVDTHTRVWFENGVLCHPASATFASETRASAKGDCRSSSNSYQGNGTAGTCGDSALVHGRAVRAHLLLSDEYRQLGGSVCVCVCVCVRV